MDVETGRITAGKGNSFIYLHTRMKTILVYLTLLCTAGCLPALAADTLTAPSGLKYLYTHKGTGERAQPGWLMIVHYIGTFTDGVKFDASRDRNEPFTFVLGKGQVIKGWDEGIALLRVGDRATFVIPYDLAYGEKGRGKIPPKATLIFDVELLDMKEKSLGMALTDAIFTDTASVNVDKGLELFRALKAKNFDGIFRSESDLNSLGYRLLMKAKNPAGALEILKLNVELYPESANVYDSVGEAYMELGQTAEAIRSYEKSLELDPKNANARDILKELREKK